MNFVEIAKNSSNLEWTARDGLLVEALDDNLLPRVLARVEDVAVVQEIVPPFGAPEGRPGM